jgi:hypothetical protein
MAKVELSPLDLDVVVGRRGPIATPEMCNGLMLPIVVFDQICSLDGEALVAAIPRPEAIPEREHEQSGRPPRSCLTGSCRSATMPGDG